MRSREVTGKGLERTAAALSFALLLSSAPRLEAQMSGSMALSGPASVNEGATGVTVTLQGTSNFDLSAFSAKVTYDSADVTFMSYNFASGVWNNADFTAVDSSTAGVLVIAATEDTGGAGGDASVPQGTNQPFVDSFFDISVDIGLCDSTSLGFGASVDDNILVDTNAVGLDTGNGLTLSGDTIILKPVGFVRGNANGSDVDGSNPSASVTIADGIYVLLDLFGGGPAPPCLDAADANDDERYNIVDGVVILQKVFGNAAVTIPPPFTVVGTDPSGSALGCAAFPTINC